ncbi:MAG: DUF4328 domain-containing protein [Nitrososphaeraceae archaeon]|nr:DUF4328 domain-containing protein [Nitrososphaeraceae archaeon]
MTKIALLLKCPICNHLSMYHDGAGCKISSCDCRKKGKEFRGEKDTIYDRVLYSTSVTYRPIGNLTNWLVRFYIFQIVMTAFSIAVTIYLALSGIFIGSLENNYGIAGLIAGVISGTSIAVISFLIFFVHLVWYYRATKNIHSFGAKWVTSPVMAVVWWFIPIFNFWKPYHVTQQIWKASNPEVHLIEGTEWKRSPSSILVKQWWALYLIAIAGLVVGGIFSGIYMESDMESEQLDQSTDLTFLGELPTIPFQVLTIISTILFIRIIKQISTWQNQKSINL